MNDSILCKSELYPNYRFSKDGKIYWNFCNKEWRELKPFKNKKYLRVNLLQKNGTRRKELLHRVIAKVFIPNPNNYPCINHKDENTYNNAVENLEWCTYQYNNNYGKRKKIILQHLNELKEKHKCPVFGVDKEGNEIQFESIKEASQELSISSGNIWSCLVGKRKTAGNLKWYRKNKEEKEK